jgi:hypothetical protein
MACPSMTHNYIAITTSGFEADIFESGLVWGPGDVAEARRWCQHVGRCHKPQFGPWNDRLSCVG